MDLMVNIRPAFKLINHLLNISLSIFAFPLNGFGQFTFQKTYSTGQSYQWSSLTDNSGNYVLAGTVYSSSAGTTDICLIKMDSNGNPVWSKTFGDTANDAAYSISVNGSNGYIICGYSQSCGIPNSQAYVLNVDSSGNLLWANLYDANYDCFAKCIKQVKGGYIITGTTITSGSFIEKIYLLKIDSSGNVLWSNSYGTSTNNEGLYVQQTQDSGYIICASIDGIAVGLIHTDSVGVKKWSSRYSGTLNYPYFITESSDKGFIVTGTASYNTNDINGFIMKIDSLGNIIWNHEYGALDDDEWFYNSIETSNGDIIAIGKTEIAGSTYSDVFLVAVDNLGDTIWTNDYGDSLQQYGTSITQDLYENLVFTNNYQDSLLYIIKSDSVGNSYCYKKRTNILVLNPPVLVNNYTVTSLPLNTQSTQCLPQIIPGSGFTDVCNGFVSTAANQTQHIKIYPIPAQKDIIIQVESICGTANIELINIIGVCVVEKQVNISGKVLINIEELPRGIYFFKYEDMCNEETKKIVIN